MKVRVTTQSLIDDGSLVIGDGYRAKNDELSREGLPFARAQNIDGGFVFDGADCFPLEHIHKVGNKLSRAGDVVFTSKGTVGRFAFVKEGTPTFVYSPQLCFWRSLDPSRIDARWLFYWMQGPAFFEQYKGVSSQTDMAEYVSLRDQRAMHIELPDIEEQRRVSALLAALDDRIEVNAKVLGTLDAVAGMLFKAWFVDFEPTLAKARGESEESIRQRLGLSREMLALFPNELVGTAHGLVPLGWNSVVLKSMTTKIGSGATPRGGRDVYVDEGVALIRSQNVYDSEFVWEGLARLTGKAAAELANVEVVSGDILLNITGASILRTCVVPDAVLPARVNQHVAIIRARAEVPSRYLHLHLLRPETKAHLLGLNAGASREAVTKGHLESVELLDPGPALLALFDEKVRAIYAQVACNNEQQRSLSATRDLLLPRLLDGRVQPTIEVEA